MCSERPVSGTFKLGVLILTLGAAIYLILSQVHVMAEETEDPRSVVFEQDPDRGYPELELTVLKAITLDAFVGDSGHRFHFPATLTLKWDPDLAKPNSTMPIYYRIVPLDGEGKEYDLARGIKFNVDVTFYDWGIKYGNDIDGHFVPPMSSDIINLNDELYNIWEKSIWCLGGASLGLYTEEEFTGQNVVIPLIATCASGSVDFASTDNNTTVVLLTSTGWVTDSLKIGACTPGDNIVITTNAAAQSPVYTIEQTESFIRPRFAAHIVHPKWYNPCNQKEWDYAFPWFDGFPTERDIEIDSEESEDLTWTLPVQSPVSGSARIQDLTVKSFRLPGGSPRSGSPDTIVSVISNLYGDIVQDYERIRLDYTLVGASAEDDRIYIGSTTLTAESPELASFNDGKTDHIRVEYIYDRNNENYVFTRDHKWNRREPYPRYNVTLTSWIADDKGPQDGLTVLNDSPSVPGNNRTLIPMSTPLPDFAIDSLYVDGPNYIQRKTGDELHFDFRVKNRGAEYVDPNAVMVTCTMFLERMTENDLLVTFHQESIYQDTLGLQTPDSCWRYEFDFVVPPSYPVDRALFVFTVNIPDSVDELIGDLDNNTMYTYLDVAEYPDSAYASDVLCKYDGEKIEPNLPDVDIDSADDIYLYITDSFFMFGMTGASPCFNVEIGLGDYETSPRSSSWNWHQCRFVKDFWDYNGQHWKVYAGSLRYFNVEEMSANSYCFRACINEFPFYSPIPDYQLNYIYVDSTGASTANAEHSTTPGIAKDNSYLYDNAGYATKGSVYGPRWICSPKNLFQDNFPSDSSDVESPIRADMAVDISFSNSIIPGDSIVVYCFSPDTTLKDYGSGGEVFMHVNADYIGADPAKPDLSGSILEGTWGRYVGAAGDWDVFRADSSYRGDSVFAGYWAFDLNDTIFTRGYRVEYYFSAVDYSDSVSTFPGGGKGTDAGLGLDYGPNNYLDWDCLPLMTSEILLVNDCEGRVWWDMGFDAVIYPENPRPEVYDVNDPGALVSNGLGSRAEIPHLGSYNLIIWDSGDFSSATISDGTIDKSEDCKLLHDWLMTSDRSVGLWVLGNNTASDLIQLSPGPAQDLLNLCAITSVIDDSYFELTGGYGLGVMNPHVMYHIEEEPVVYDNDWFSLVGNDRNRDEFLGVHSFDVLETVPAKHTLKYRTLEYGDPPYHAGIYNEPINNNADTCYTLWFGTGYEFIADTLSGAPPCPIARNRMLYNALVLFPLTSTYISPDITGDETPPAGKYDFSQNYPNPFNPFTTIRYSIPVKEHVKLKIYNVAGQLVRILVDEVVEAGTHEIRWDGRNENGFEVASGVYFCRIKSGEFMRVKKLVILR